jgi:tetratricopeptide (TPR) repeat protein
MDLYFQGLAWLYQAATPDNVARARSFFDRALAADTDNIDALIGSAMADAVEGSLSLAADPMAALAAAEAKVTKALSAVPDHAQGHMLLGWVEIVTNRAAQGMAECEHALRLNPNLAIAHALIGLGKIYTGRVEESEAHIAEALRLSPRDTTAHAWMTFAGVAKAGSGRYEQAAAWCRRAIEANRNYPPAHFWLAAALAQLGRLNEAHSALKAGLALDRNFTVSRARASWTAQSDNSTFLAGLEPIFDGLRKAGMPEGAKSTN